MSTTLSRIEVGPESAGLRAGPRLLWAGRHRPTVTDADVVLGRIDPERFAGGTIALDAERRASRDRRSRSASRSVSTRSWPPLGISEIVEENMANAARVHAVERGKELGDRTLIAFGGAAPLHAARLAEKLGIDTVVVPTGAGVGSALGFLAGAGRLRGRAQPLVRLDDSFDPAGVNALAP